ncbi:MAG: DNA translocase FtsK [bacterium]
MPSSQPQKNINHHRPPLTGAILVVATSLLVLVSLFSERTGLVGGFFQRVLLTLFGMAAYSLPVISLAAALMIMLGRKIKGDQLGGLMLLFLAFVVALQLGWEPTPLYPSGRGGLIGHLLSLGLLRLFGRIGSFILLGTLTILGLTLINEDAFILLAASFKKRVDNVRQAAPSLVKSEAATTKVKPKTDCAKFIKIKKAEALSTDTEQLTEVSCSSEDELAVAHYPPELNHGSFRLPSLSLLRRSVRLNDQRLEKDINENVQILEQTLVNFGVKAKVTEVSCGPAITRYEIHPSPGTKVSRVVSLADDIALALAATGIRIEAPIPGKAAIGIEVPNKEIQPVFLREVIESASFAESGSALTIGLGKDISGTPIVADLAKMPHLLIAGATGSGKSVCINSLISSILFKSTPSQVKLLLIDPKMVELASFNGIPHLLAPVVTDVKKAAGVLNWAVTEMENRYNLFAAAGVRDIKRYNQTTPESPLPLILVVIDELADLMMVSPADVEEAICRLAQMARAAGIHLVVATQRPSVDVITGLIKANIPSRLSFAVSSQTDSRTILDMNGAEKLLGKGDMLFFPVGSAKPKRVQGAFISDKEVESLVKFWHNQGEPEFQEEILTVQVKSKDNQIEEDVDELFDQALELIVETGQASASYFQRRFRIGYTRAARIIDQLADKGYVGPLEGSKPRQVLISKERYQHLKDSTEL